MGGLAVLPTAPLWVYRVAGNHKEGYDEKDEEAVEVEVVTVIVANRWMSLLDFAEFQPCIINFTIIFR